MRPNPINPTLRPVEDDYFIAEEFASTLREHATGDVVSVLPRELSDRLRLEKRVNLRALPQAVQMACVHQQALQEC